MFGREDEGKDEGNSAAVPLPLDQFVFAGSQSSLPNSFIVYQILACQVCPLLP